MFKICLTSNCYLDCLVIQITKPGDKVGALAHLSCGLFILISSYLALEEIKQLNSSFVQYTSYLTLVVIKRDMNIKL